MSSVNRGKITLILSCMFAGKTETLITHARRYILAKKKVVLIKYANDNRYTVEYICSHHNLNNIKATFSCKRLSDLYNSQELRDAQVVLIDEVQFFHDAPEVCDKLANEGKIIVAAGLNGNYLREEFPVISRLIPLSEDFISLNAICSLCGELAHFSKRMVSGSELELIGGMESYQPRCRSCFSVNK